MNQPVCQCASVYIYVPELYTLSFALTARERFSVWRHESGGIFRYILFYFEAEIYRTVTQ